MTWRIAVTGGTTTIIMAATAADAAAPGSLTMASFVSLHWQ